MRTHVRVLAFGLACAFAVVGVVQAESTPVPKNPNLIVKADAKRISAGDIVSVDVLIRDVSDLAVYQVQMTATGGRQGALELDSIVIDKEREDFVFGDAGSQIIDAVDATKSRAGALVMTGSTDVRDARYLVTYNFRASNNASGTFTVGVRSGEETFLLSPTSQRLGTKADTGVEVTVGRTASRKGR